MEAQATKTSKPKKSVLKSLFLIFKWMGKYWPLLIISFGFLVIVSYTRTLIPLFTQHIVDYVLKYDLEEGSRLPAFIFKFVNQGSDLNKLLLAAVGIIIVDFIRSISIFFRRSATAVFSERVTYDLRNNLYKKLQNLSYGFHSHSETGDLIQRCTTDVETYKNFISDQIIEVMRLVLLVGFSIYQMARLNLNMMFISLIITPLLFTIAIIFFKRVEKEFTTIEENEAKMTTHVQENVSGARVVKAFANEKFEIEKFEGLNRKFTDSDYVLTKHHAVFWSTTDFICFAQFCVVAVVGIIYATRGYISLGIYSAFLAFAGNIIWPMRQLGRIVGDFSKATVSVGRLNEIIEQKDEYGDTQGTLKPVISGNIHFDHVNFKFPDSNYHQLEDISFEVKKGETVAIIGKTGSGKSSLINLLVKLLDFQEGHIYFDEIDIKNIEKHHLRNNVGIILQEPFLFSKTVEENIKISDRSLDSERVAEVAKIAKVHEDIVGFEKGYKTLVGERGVTLSGGQKQRVAIARMLLKPKPILVFDDSLSAVDTETDLQIRKALKKEWKESTVLIITHRITTAKEADRILVLDHGKIAESGTHDQLLTQGGLYKNIWDIQSRIDFQIEDGE